MAFALAFAGKIGSGKTAMTTALAQALECKRASFGDYVRQVVNSRALEHTRENLQKIGTELLEHDRSAFCDAVLRHAGWIRGDGLLIDGLRHVETIDPLQQLVSPATLKLIYIEISDSMRLERLKARGEGNPVALAVTEAHSSEKQVGAVLAYRADLIINGDDSIRENVHRVSKWIQT